MRILGLLLSLMAALALTAVAAEPASPDVFANAGFKITLPSNATAAIQRGPDFDVYYVTWGTTGHLGLYEGCCPQTFLAGPDVQTNDITINGLKAKELKRSDGTALSRELHITIARPGTTYTMIVHTWYKSLSADDAAIADRILATITAK